MNLRELAIATLDAVYDELGIVKAPIVASSAGGPWAWWYAIERPERVPATVQLGAPVPVDGVAWPPEMRMLGIAGLNRMLLSILEPDGPHNAVDVYTFLGHSPEMVEATSPALREYEYRTRKLPTYRLAWRSHIQEVTGALGGLSDAYIVGPDELSRLEGPALVLWATNDVFGDVDAGRRIAGLLPNADLQVLGDGHFLWLDEPAGAASLLDGHLRTIGEDPL